MMLRWINVHVLDKEIIMTVKALIFKPETYELRNVVKHYNPSLFYFFCENLDVYLYSSEMPVCFLTSLEAEKRLREDLLNNYGKFTSIIEI